MPHSLVQSCSLTSPQGVEKKNEIIAWITYLYYLLPTCLDVQGQTAFMVHLQTPELSSWLSWSPLRDDSTAIQEGSGPSRYVGVEKKQKQALNWCEFLEIKCTEMTKAVIFINHFDKSLPAPENCKLSVLPASSWDAAEHFQTCTKAKWPHTVCSSQMLTTEETPLSRK